MKLNYQTAEIQDSGLLSKQEATVSLNPVILHVLSRDLYQKHIESPFREVLINALDAHVEAGTMRPVEIHLPTAFNELFYIRDYGPGLSHERFMSIYLDYGNSTRRDDNDRHGGLGLGTKSPLAYTTSFSVDSFYEGTLRNYIVYYNENNVPCVALLSEKETDEPNGLKVSYTTVNFSDYYQFLSSANTLLSRIPKDKYCIVNEGLTIDAELPEGQSFGKIKLVPKSTDKIKILMGYVAYKFEENTILDFLQKRKNLTLTVKQKDSADIILPAYDVVKKLISASNVEITSSIGDYPVHPSREYINITPNSINKFVSDLQSGLDILFSLGDKDLTSILQKKQLTGICSIEEKIRAVYLNVTYSYQKATYVKIVNSFSDLLDDISSAGNKAFKVAYLSQFNFTDYLASGRRNKYYEFPDNFNCKDFALLIFDKEKSEKEILDLFTQYEEFDLSSHVEKRKQELLEESKLVDPVVRIKYRKITASLQDPKHNVQFLREGQLGTSKHSWISGQHNVQSLKDLKKLVYWVPTYNGNINKQPDSIEIIKQYNAVLDMIPAWKRPIIIGLPASKGTKMIEKEFLPISELKSWLEQWLQTDYVKRRSFIQSLANVKGIAYKDYSNLVSYGPAEWLNRLQRINEKYSYRYVAAKLDPVKILLVEEKVKDLCIKFPKEVLNNYGYAGEHTYYKYDCVKEWAKQVAEYTNNKPTGAKYKNGN